MHSKTGRPSFGIHIVCMSTQYARPIMAYQGNRCKAKRPVQVCRCNRFSLEGRKEGRF